jgi:hypothetical protein
MAQFLRIVVFLHIARAVALTSSLSLRRRTHPSCGHNIEENDQSQSMTDDCSQMLLDRSSPFIRSNGAARNRGIGGGRYEIPERRYRGLDSGSLGRQAIFIASRRQA